MIKETLSEISGSPLFIKTDIKIGLTKGAKIAKPLKIAERTLSFFLCALCVLCENLFFISDNV
ncbi:MAG: hypothetical protein BWK80_06510 [Desulfobacteraceae bacterium IS3]|nr:MAG: hypothetical protein BWK80_06510 [Desulfobacteraceae bacterium IS3]